MGCGGSKEETKGGGSATSNAGTRTQQASAPDGRKDLLKYLGGVPLFAKMSKAEQEILAKAFEMKKYREGEVIVQEGDTGDTFYVVTDGEAVVAMAAMVIAVLHKGDFFGENALTSSGHKRIATIAAQEEVTCFSLSKAQLDKVTEVSLKKNKGRVSVAGAKSGGDEGSRQKSRQTADVIEKALRSNANLKVLVALETEQVRSVVAKTWRLEVNKGRTLVTQGEQDADRFYLVEKGRFEVYISTSKTSVDSIAAGMSQMVPEGFNETTVRKSQANTNLDFGAAVSTSGGKNSISVKRDSKAPGGAPGGAPKRIVPERTMVAERGPGSSFGELALLHSSPRSATIECAEDAVVWVLDRTDFRACLVEYAEKKADQWCGLLGVGELFKKLTAEQLRAVSQECEEIHFGDDSKIIVQGEEGDSFYIIQAGRCDVIINGETVKQLYRGDCFGERALLSSEKRAATIFVPADCGGADVLKLDSDAFRDTLGASAFAQAKAAFLKQEVEEELVPRKPPEDFIVVAPSKLDQSLGVVGVGEFDVTKLVKDSDSGAVYSLKRVHHGILAAKGMQQQVMREREILNKVASSFVQKCHLMYREEGLFCFLMEPCLGGNLQQIFEKEKLHGKEQVAQFYIACVAFALDDLYAHHCIHRNVHAESVILDSRGYGKLSNFDLAKCTVCRTYTFCGSPEYLAPEVVSLKSGYGRAMDWWALGVTLYELMTQATPFDSMDPMEIYKKIRRGASSITWPETLAYNAKQCIAGFLEMHPRERLGMKGKFEGLKTNEFFEGLKWDKLHDQTLDPPHKPKVNGPQDLSQFPQATLQKQAEDLENVDKSLGAKELDKELEEFRPTAKTLEDEVAARKTKGEKLPFKATRSSFVQVPAAVSSTSDSKVIESNGKPEDAPAVAPLRLGNVSVADDTDEAKLFEDGEHAPNSQFEWVGGEGRGDPMSPRSQFNSKLKSCWKCSC